MAPLHCTQLIVIAGRRAETLSGVALVYDMEQGSAPLEFETPTPITAVAVRRDCVVLATDSGEIAVYELALNPRPPLLLRGAPHGTSVLLALSASADSMALAFPAERPVGKTPEHLGVLHVVHINANAIGEIASEYCLDAHKDPLRAIAVNYHGTLAVTTSDKGAIIRVWSLQHGTAAGAASSKTRLMYSMRNWSPRGVTVASLAVCSSSLDRPQIACLNIDRSAGLTVHLFDTAVSNITKEATELIHGYANQHTAAHVIADARADDAARVCMCEPESFVTSAGRTRTSPSMHVVTSDGALLYLTHRAADSTGFAVRLAHVAALQLADDSMPMLPPN